MGKNDWAETIENDIEEIKIDENSIMTTKKHKFKMIVKKKINDAAFEYLTKIKETHSKVKDIVYKKLEIQPYILESKMSTKEKQLLL